MAESSTTFKIDDSFKSDKKQSPNISRLQNELNLMKEHNLVELNSHIQNVQRCIFKLNASVILQNYRRYMYILLYILRLKFKLNNILQYAKFKIFINKTVFACFYIF